MFPFSCTRFKNEEGLCLSCCLQQAHFRSAQSHFRLVGPLNRDLISGESRIVNYLRRIDSVWVYWTYLYTEAQTLTISYIFLVNKALALPMHVKARYGDVGVSELKVGVSIPGLGRRVLP